MLLNLSKIIFGKDGVNDRAKDAVSDSVAFFIKDKIEYEIDTLQTYRYTENIVRSQLIIITESEKIKAIKQAIQGVDMTNPRLARELHDAIFN